MTVRLAVVGTRVLCAVDHDRAAERIEQAIVQLHPTVVISGGAQGVDALAEFTAKRCGFTEGNGTLIVHRAITTQFHGRGGFKERDALIAADCTHLLRLACSRGTTYGSGWTADEAERRGKVVVRFTLCKVQAW